MRLYRWRVYCETEAALVATTSWWPEGEQPTTCPNNSEHTVDGESWTIIGTIEDAVPLDEDGNVKTAPLIHSEGAALAADEGEFVVPSGQAVDAAYNFDVKFRDVQTQDDVTVELYTGSGFVDENGRRGDFIDVVVIDIDNVLGYGAGVVLWRYLHHHRVKTPDDYIWVPTPHKVRKLEAGVYLRFVYTPKGTQTAEDITVWPQMAYYATAPAEMYVPT